MSISRLNFLQYDDGPFWRFVGRNGQNYQNRLRHSDYLALFRATGWEVVDAAGEPDAPSLRAIVGLALAARFRGYAHEDLAILTSSIVVRRPA